jgi:hypothetical protein
MQVQPPGMKLGMPWINETIGPVQLVERCFAVCAWISVTDGLIKGIGMPFSVTLA